MFENKNNKKDIDFIKIIVALNPGVKKPQDINDTNELDQQIQLLQKAVKATFYKMSIIVGAAFIAFFISKYRINKNEVGNSIVQNPSISNPQKGDIAEEQIDEVDKTDFNKHSWNSNIITSTNDLGVEVDQSFPIFSISGENMILVDHKDGFDIVTSYAIGKDLKKPLIRADKVKYLYSDDKFISFINQSNKKNYGDEFVFIDQEGNLMETIKPSDNPITISSYAIKDRDIYFTIENSSKLFKLNIDSKSVDSFHTNHSEELVLTSINEDYALLRDKNIIDAAEVLGLSSGSYIVVNLDENKDIQLFSKEIGEYPIWDNGNAYTMKYNKDNNTHSLILDEEIVLNKIEYVKIKDDQIYFIRDGLFQSININNPDDIKTYDVNTKQLLDFYLYDKYIILITKDANPMYNNYIDLIEI